MKRHRLAMLSELTEGKVVVFAYQQDGIKREGLLLQTAGKIVCYENMCRHLPVRLDSGTRHFLTKAGDRLLCQSHGALYHFETGFCERGPCAGASLKALPVIVQDDAVYLDVQDEIS
jgi:nitrite reductase/ring-hydroxylating ferredoxin subunit